MPEDADIGPPPAPGDADVLARPPLREVARVLLDIRTGPDPLPEGEIGYVLLLELIWTHPRQLSFAELSELTGTPLPEVFRTVTALARRGMIAFRCDAPLLREHHIGLTEGARARVEEHLRRSSGALIGLYRQAYPDAA